jgi:hypothetical protein
LVFLEQGIELQFMFEFNIDLKIFHEVHVAEDLIGKLWVWVKPSARPISSDHSKPARLGVGTRGPVRNASRLLVTSFFRNQPFAIGW